MTIKGLRKCLREFDENGRYASAGEWSIARGGYDLWWQLSYAGTPVIDCVAGKLRNDSLEERDFQRISSIIKEEYPDVRI